MAYIHLFRKNRRIISILSFSRIFVDMNTNNEQGRKARAVRLYPYYIGGLLLSSILPLAGANAKASKTSNKPTERPNIIIFMVDDMGWQDTSYPFAKDTTALNRRYHTPNMERLAREGVAFTSAYASSVSSPSRVSLLTGMNAARHRVTNWTLEKNTSTDIESKVLKFPEWNLNGIAQAPGIPYTVEVNSLAELLKDSGYHTIHCGKAHWGAIDTPGESPNHMGFEVNIAGHAAGGLASYHGEKRFGHDAEGKPWSNMSTPGLERYWDQPIFATEALTLEAVRALERAKKLDQPFFLHMSHYAVHVPFDKDERFMPKYRAMGMSENEAAYAALVEGMDKSLGDLLDWLEKNGLKDNTAILFLSDNGGLSSSDYWRDRPLYVHNAPLNSGKGSAYEGGVRIPMIARYAQPLTQGERCDVPVIIEDVFPTILELAGVKGVKTKQKVDGKSFLPLFNPAQTASPKRSQLAKEAKSRAMYWNYPNLWGNTGPGIGPTCSILLDGYKLIYYYETGEKELFHITSDLGETKNLAQSDPKRTKYLSQRLGKYLRSVDAQRPSFRQTGKPCPWPDEI